METHVVITQTIVYVYVVSLFPRTTDQASCVTQLMLLDRDKLNQLCRKQFCPGRDALMGKIY